jgi:hypothetical protein
VKSREETGFSPFSLLRSALYERFFFLHNAHCLRPAAHWQVTNGSGPLHTARPRRTAQVVVSTGAVYTSGHPLEIGPKILTFSHFSGRPV